MSGIFKAEPAGIHVAKGFKSKWYRVILGFSGAFLASERRAVSDFQPSVVCGACDLGWRGTFGAVLLFLAGCLFLAGFIFAG